MSDESMSSSAPSADSGIGGGSVQDLHSHASMMHNHHHHAHMASTAAPAKPVSPHLLHLIATLITGGLWLPVWIYYALFWKKKKPPDP